VVAERLFKGKKDLYKHSVKDHFVESRLGELNLTSSVINTFTL